MYGMTHQKALKTGTIVAALLITVSLATQQLAQAQQSQDRGLLGNFADGNRDGLAAGEMSLLSPQHIFCLPSYD
jgi:hypothetical protein